MLDNEAHTNIGFEASTVPLPLLSLPRFSFELIDLESSLRL